MALVTESSALCRRTRAPTCSRVNQATFLPDSTTAWPRASSRKVLPVPDGPQTTRFSCRPIHSRVRSADWVGAGTEDRCSSQASNVFPVGKAALARRVAREELVPPGDLFGEQGPQDFGGVPPLGFGRGDDLGRGPAHVGQPHAAQQLLQAGVQRRRGRGRGGHRALLTGVGKSRWSTARQTL